MKMAKKKAVNKRIIILVLIKSLHKTPMAQLDLLRLEQSKRSVNQRLVCGIRLSLFPDNRQKKRKSLLVFVRTTKKIHRKITAQCKLCTHLKIVRLLRLPCADPSWIQSVVKVLCQNFWWSQRTRPCLVSHTLRILTILLKLARLKFLQRNLECPRYQSIYEPTIPLRLQLNESCAKVRSQ